MLDRATLGVVPPYLRTLWRSLDSDRLKGGGGGERGGYIGLPRTVTSEDFHFLFFWISAYFRLYIAYLLENLEPFRVN